MVEIMQQVHHVVPGFHVHAGSRLIEKEQLGVAHQSAGQENTLLLTTGQLPDVPLGQVGDAEALHDIMRQFPLLPTEPGKQRV